MIPCMSRALSSLTVEKPTREQIAREANRCGVTQYRFAEALLRVWKQATEQQRMSSLYGLEDGGTSTGADKQVEASPTAA